MYGAWIFAAALAVASADVSHLGYTYKAPLTPFSSGSLLGSPIRDYNFKSFPFGYNSGRYFESSTPLPVVSSTASPFVVSSTASPLVVSSTPSPVVVSSTPSPAVVSSFPTVTSTPSPLFGSKYYSGFSSTINPLLYGSSFPTYGGSFPTVSSTPAPLLSDINSFPAITSTVSPLLSGDFDSGKYFSSIGSTPSPLLVNDFDSSFVSSTPLIYNYGDVSSTVQPLVSFAEKLNTKYESKFYQVQQPPQVFKHFYVHSAPEEPEEPKPRTPIVLPPAQKHYKIIFVKAPSVSSRTSAIVPVQPQTEEKTIVYVLSKKPEEQSEIIVPKVEQKPPSKPEVFFIKYNNKEDSDTVINNIVNEYNNKPGQTVSFSGGASEFTTAAPSYSTISPSFPTLAPSFPTLAPSFPTLAPSFPTLAPSFPTLAPRFPTVAPSFPSIAPTFSTLAPTYNPDFSSFYTTVKPYSFSSAFSGLPSFSSFSSPSLGELPKSTSYIFGSGLSSSGLSSGSGSSLFADSVFSSGSSLSSGSSILGDSKASGSTIGSSIAEEPVVSIGGSQTFTNTESSTAASPSDSSALNSAADENNDSPKLSASDSSDDASNDIDLSSTQDEPKETYESPKFREE